MIAIIKLIVTPGVPTAQGTDNIAAIRHGLGRDDTIVIDPVAGEALPAPSDCRGVVLTGSRAMVTERLPWSERVAAWLPTLLEAGTPMLGICYGHQLLAHAMGGLVGPNATGRELGMVQVMLSEAAADDPLFGTLPARFDAQVCHRQSVLRLPEQAIRLASSLRDACQAYRLGPSAWGVQFHPEFSEQVTRNQIEHYAAELEAEGQVLAELRASVRPAPEATSVLSRFAALVDGRATPSDYLRRSS